MALTCIKLQVDWEQAVDTAQAERSCASRQSASGWPKQHITGVTIYRQAGRPVHALEPK
jgi:hypothetical protein